MPMGDYPGTRETTQHDEIGRHDEIGSGRSGTVLLLALLLVVGAAAWAWFTGSVGSLPLRPHCTATASNSTTDLDPEQTGNAAVIAGVAGKRSLPARTASIGIATAMQESKLRNLNYGDRDSLGLFQQRPSQGWGSAQQLQDPVYASNAFFDVLVKIDGYQDLPITTVAQKVQHSAFPGAYADHEPQARIFASALAGYSPGALNCVLTPAKADQQARGADGLTPRAAALVAAANRETGRRGVPGSADGTTVRFSLAGREGARLSWALAQWAVARADGLSVVSVQVDGKQWRRASPNAGWTAITGGPAAGVVLVQLAN
jgi:hypothetical protein